MAARAAILLVAGLLGALIAAPAVRGQAAVDQYVPALEPGKRKQAGTPPSAAGGGGIQPAIPTETPTGAQSVKTSDGESGGGTLPGSDFPLTPFVLLVILLLLLGVIARLVWPRLRAALASVPDG